jgi:hypothetical protein
LHELLLLLQLPGTLVSFQIRAQEVSNRNGDEELSEADGRRMIQVGQLEKIHDLLLGQGSGRAGHSLKGVTETLGGEGAELLHAQRAHACGDGREL